MFFKKRRSHQPVLLTTPKNQHAVSLSLSLSLSLSFVKLNHLLTLLLLLAIFVESLIICVDAMSLNEVNSVN